MKTLKISETTHKELTELQAYLYKTTNLKFTFNEIIMNLVTNYEKKVDLTHD